VIAVQQELSDTVIRILTPAVSYSYESKHYEWQRRCRRLVRVFRVNSYGSYTRWVELDWQSGQSVPELFDDYSHDLAGHKLTAMT